MTQGIFLHNRADGVDGHYCIGRHNDAGNFAEFWTESSQSFTSAGTVYIGEDIARSKLETLIKSCDNCNKTYERLYPNGGKLCFGIVNIPFRACDMVRKCQTYDTGKSFLEDLALDEATEALTGYAITVNSLVAFTYERPCAECNVPADDCNYGERQ